MKVIWDSGVGGDIEQGAVMLSLLSQKANGVIASYTARVYYKDT